MEQRSQTIVIGSGPAGMAATCALVVRGCRVLLVDGSDGGASSGRGTAGAPFERRPDFLAQYFTALAHDLSPKIAALNARGDVTRYLAQNRVQLENFHALGLLATGGLSTVWGGTMSPYSARDLLLCHLREADLRASYETILQRLGLGPLCRWTGPTTLQGGPSAEHTPSALESALWRRLQSGVQRGNQISERTVFQFVPRLAYDFSRDLPRLLRTGLVEYRPGILVDTLVPSNRLNGGYLLRLRSSSSARETWWAKTVVVAAGAIATTRILARVCGLEGKLIPFLNTPCFVFAFVLPGLLGHQTLGSQVAPLQLVCSSALTGDDVAVAQVYSGADLPAPHLTHHLPLTTKGGIALTKAVQPCLGVCRLYLPSVYSHNAAFVEVERGGECQVTIRGQTNEQCLEQARIAFHQVSRALRRLGAFVLPRTFREIPLGQDAHYGGTLPMNCLTSKEGEVVGHNRLFAVDGSVLGSLSATSPTLTIMANVDRIGSIVADRLRHDFSSGHESVARIP